jgi:hypothetical protein
MRVYTQIDAGLTFHDMQARIRLHAKGQSDISFNFSIFP